MTKELERDLGLVAVVAISIGAMVGSGIFILPALAMELAGPGVVLAYLVAGLLVLPAALSKSEMATAMPEAGGTYVFIERAMGPLYGTVAGVGTWFSLSFKGALALVGGVPYLVLFFDLPVTPVALSLATVLILVNLLGAKQTGRLQVGIVAVMLVALAWFVFGSGGSVQSAQFEGFFDTGAGGILAATGFVFVSYAGVTKIASVAEEVEDPGRIIPLGILISLGFTTVLYVLIVAVVVGVVPGTELVGSKTPIADVAEATLADPGVIAVVAAAMLALISTANAGVLSASRYPFAMSRDGLAPPSLQSISDRFKTPSNAITLTGVVMLLLIAFVPIENIAKLASAFQIVVFVLVTIAHVALRHGDHPWYEPEWTAPFYPWIQGVGIVGGIVLLTQMGLVPLAGAVGITVASVLWYFLYARPRVDREGAMRETIRQSAGRRALDQTRDQLDDSGYEVLVALSEDATRERERVLLGAADALARDGDGHVAVLQFDRVPDQVPLEYASTVMSTGDVAFESRTDDLAAEVDSPVHYGEIVSHDPKRAVVNTAERREVDLLVLDRESDFGGGGWPGSDAIDWIRSHAPCDGLVVDAAEVGGVDRIALVVTRGTDDSLKVRLASALARYADADLDLVSSVTEGGSVGQQEALEKYHEELAPMVSIDTTSTIVDESALDETLDDADVVLYSRSEGVLARLVGLPRAHVPGELEALGIEVSTFSPRRRRLARLTDRGA